MCAFVRKSLDYVDLYRIFLVLGFYSGEFITFKVHLSLYVREE